MLTFTALFLTDHLVKDVQQGVRVSMRALAALGLGAAFGADEILLLTACQNLNHLDTCRGSHLFETLVPTVGRARDKVRRKIDYDRHFKDNNT